MQSITAVTTTVEKKEDAAKLIEYLFKKKLIGCAQISSPVKSYYRWEGEMVNSTEILVSVKTLSSHSSKVMQTIKEQHPYDLPEIAGVVLDNVSQEYLEWLAGEIE